MLAPRYVLHAFQNMGTVANILTWSTWPPARCTSWRSAALLCHAHRVYKVQLYNHLLFNYYHYQLFNYHCCVSVTGSTKFNYVINYSIITVVSRSPGLQSWDHPPLQQDHHYIRIIISNTHTINILFNYANIDKDYSNKARRPGKKLLFFWILSKLPPPICTTCTTFFNVDLSDIQNDSLSKILLE